MALASLEVSCATHQRQLTKKKFIPLLKQLRKLLENDDAEAVEVLDELHALLEGNAVDAGLSQVGKVSSDYDFDVALEKLTITEEKIVP